MFSNFFPKILPLKNVVETDRPQMTIWCMNVACWISNAIDTQSDYVIFVALSASHISNPSSILRVMRIRTLGHMGGGDRCGGDAL